MPTVDKTPTKTIVKTIANAPGKKTVKSAPIKAATTAKKSTSTPAQKTIAKPASKAPATFVQAKTSIKKSKTATELTKAVVTPAIKSITPKPIKDKKIKLVRDSFTIPKPEYLILDNLKLRAADLKHPVKKSELLRAGIKALAAMTDAQLLLALKAVPALKTGRPGK